MVTTEDYQLALLKESFASMIQSAIEKIIEEIEELSSKVYDESLTVAENDIQETKSDDADF